MPGSMHTVSIPIFIQHLNSLNTVLDKAAAWVAARKVNAADICSIWRDRCGPRPITPPTRPGVSPAHARAQRVCPGGPIGH